MVGLIDNEKLNSSAILSLIILLEKFSTLFRDGLSKETAEQLLEGLGKLIPLLLYRCENELERIISILRETKNYVGSFPDYSRFAQVVRKLANIVSKGEHRREIEDLMSRLAENEGKIKI